MTISKKQQNSLILRSIFLVMILPWTGRAELIEDDSQSDYARPMNIFSAGAGAIVTKEPYKGVDTESRGIPFFLYRTERLSLYGPMMSYSLFEDEHWEMDAIAKVRFEGYEDDDSRFLQGMDDREWTMELGGSLSKNLAAGDLTVDFAADILNEHKGHEIRLYYSYDFRNVLRNQALTVSPNVGLSYRNHQLNDYYYGVRSSEATASRPEYHVGDSTGLMAGLMGNYKLRENLNLTVLISFEWLGDEIRSSPIVDKDHIESFLLGIIYMF